MFVIFGTLNDKAHLLRKYLQTAIAWNYIAAPFETLFRQWKHLSFSSSNI